MKTIEDLIKDQIAELDIEDLVRAEIRKIISDDVKRNITKITNDEIQKVIKTEIEIQLSKGVTTNDGWGKSEKFESFEQMFKEYFKKALDNKYEIQRMVKDHMSDIANKLVKEKTTDIMKALQSGFDNIKV